MSSSEVLYSEEELQSWREWIGERVSISGVKYGILRYFGETKFCSGIWCGVELDEPIGKNNGIVKGVQYFSCKENYGIFAPLAKTLKVLNDNIVPQKKAMRSKLPSPKVKHNQRYSTSNLDETFNALNPSVGKSLLPMSISANNNSNNNNANLMNETFKKIQNLTFDSEQIIETLNNGDHRSPKTKANLPSNMSLSKYTVLKKQLDFHNTTLTHNNDDCNKNIICQRVPDFDATFLFTNNNLQGSIQKLLPPDISGTHNGTFILDTDKPEVGDIDKPKQEALGSNENLLSIDFDESLGILSPSEMKDFTLSFDNTLVEAAQKPLGIPKNESCDDVNDLPESETATSDEAMDTLVQDNDSTLSSSTKSFVRRMVVDEVSNKTLECEIEEISSKLVHSCDVAVENIPKPSNEASNIAPINLLVECDKMETKHPSPLNNNEALEYFHFSACLDAAQSLNSSFGISDMPCDPSANAAVPDTLVNSNKNCNVTHEKNDFCSLGIKQYASEVTDNRCSFSPITSEKMPSLLSNLSDLDKDTRDSLSFLGAVPSPLSASVLCGKNLINFSVDSPLLRNISSNINNVSKPLEHIDDVKVCSTEVILDNKPHSSKHNRLQDFDLMNFSGDSERKLVIKTESPLVIDHLTKSFVTLDSSLQPLGQHLSSDVDKVDTVINVNPTSHVPIENSQAATTLSLSQYDESSVPENPGSEDLIQIPKMDIVHSSSSNVENLDIFNKCQNITFSINETESVVSPPINENNKNASMKCDENISVDGKNIVCLELNKEDAVPDENFVLNQAVCKQPSVSSQLNITSDICEKNNLLNLMQTFSNDKVKSLLSETVVLDREQNNDSQQTTDSPHDVGESHDSPLFNGKIEDISFISGDGGCFEMSDVFDPEEVFSPIVDRHNATYHVSTSASANHDKVDSPLLRRKTMFSIGSNSKTSEQKLLIQPAKPVKPQKKNIVSKVKMMIETRDGSTNQENINVKSASCGQKKPGKWDAITSKISAGITKNKTPEIKKDVSSKISTNLSIARHSTPKNYSPARSIFKKEKNAEGTKLSDSESTSSKNLKNASSNQRMDSKSNDGDNKESRILVQLQNVGTSTKSNEGFKVPLFPLKKKKIGGSQLPSPSGSASSSNTVPSASKIGIPSRKSVLVKASTTAASALRAPSKLDLPSTQTTSKVKNIVGKPKELSKESKGSRWPATAIASKPGPRTEPRKFVSKTELVREIQELGANCENRTKELNLLKMRLRHAALGFEALSVLNKYMIEEFDPFSQPVLAKQYEKAKEELSRLGPKLQFYQDQLKNLQALHSEELKELTEKLGVVHEDEINELKSRHADELAEVDKNHKQQMKRLREDFKNQAEENEEQNCKLFKELQEDYKKQKQELEESHTKKLHSVTLHYEEVQQQLQKRLENLNEQYSLIQKQLKEAEAAFMKDKNSKIQYISAKKTELEKEVDSLKAVLEIKTTQIQDLHKENFKIKKELEELPAAKEKIRKLETKTEDLKALMQEKVKLHRELSTENQQLVLICEKEAKNNSRLSMANEELLWRLQRSVENSMRSTSLCGSPDLWKRDDEDQRSSSRMSLPILQSEKLRSGSENSAVPNSPSRAEDWPNTRGHSMSLSWHPALTTHAEAPDTSTPLPRERSRSAKGPRFHLPPQVKLSNVKLKKEIEADILRRNSALRQQILAGRPPAPGQPPPPGNMMSMSWGGESFTDYYEELDDSSMQLYAEQRSGKSRKFFIKCENPERSRGGKKSRQSVPANFLCDAEIDIEKSISGLTSLQGSFYSSSDSSSSYLPTHPSSEASNSSSPSSDNKSQDSNGYLASYDAPPSCVKPPLELAGESMIQDVESVPPAFLKSNGVQKEDALTEASSSSPDNGANLTSVATPSIETSSQGMADSTNLDVSWGDEEMFSEND